MPSGHILVADDDAGIRTVLNQALTRAGYEVRATGTVAGLWRWVAAGEGDLPARPRFRSRPRNQAICWRAAAAAGRRSRRSCTRQAA